MVISDNNDRDSSHQGAPGSTSPDQHLEPAKRRRVLLSCHTCRSSKLKCDRAVPCGQCLRRGRPDTCAYAPRLEKKRAPKTMAARLRHLEGLVRRMVDSDKPESGSSSVSRDEGHSTRASGGSLVHGERGTNYVGGTHFMAILEDLGDLKAYFEDPEDAELDVKDSHESVALNEIEMLLPSQGGPRSKEEFLTLLPSKTEMDRLMNRYFNSNTPSQQIIHTPTFTKQYNQFLQNRQDADIHWIATLFMILGLGVFFSSFQAPHELNVDSTVPAMDKFRQYRSACGWALASGKYSQPGSFTLQALLLYTEAEFIVNRVSQTTCYLLCSTLIRLMLKMGLHRDPSKLPRITPYQGEMRRRLWHIAIQIDLLVSFHLGLPSMINGIESDTALPSNLLDSDFDEDSTQLPSSRPSTEYTSLTYVINKSKLVRVFGLVARLSHSLTVPMHDEVMRFDACLREVWSEVPIFMKVKPLSESITDAPMLVIQRFGLASLFQKSRCVLHRRYIADPNPLKEHDYSRRTCLEAAVTMLDYQRTIFEATKPGAILSQNRWFLASLVINDYLLADMVVALALQQLSKVDCLDWMTACSPPLTKASLIGLLRGSYSIWIQMLGTLTDCRKAVNVVRKMILRIQTQLDITILDSESESESASPYDNRRTESSAGEEHTSPISNISAYAVSLIQGRNGNSRSHDMGSSVNDTINLDTAKLGFGSVEGVAMQQDMTEVWPLPEPQGGYDWDQFDAMTRGPTDSGTIIPQIPDQNWMDESGYSGFDDFPTINSWSSFRSN